MLRLRHLLSAVRAASPLPTASSLTVHRLFLHSTTNTAPASQFVVEDYLTTNCGLTPEQARRASGYLPNLKSPDNADAVRAFLAGIGVSKAEVAAAISREPRILCSKVDIALTPRIAQLRCDVGLSSSQISRLISIVPTILVAPLIPRLAFYLSFLGSYDNLHTALRRSMYLLPQSVERVVKPNMAFLRQSGLTDSDIAKLLLATPGMFTLELGRVKEIVECADLFGVPRDSAMFKHAVVSIRYISPRKISARSDFLKKTIGRSQTELGTAVRKLPNVLNFSEGRMSRVVDFLKTEVGLEPKYIVRRPAVLTYSLGRRLMPRHYFLKALKAKGLVAKGLVEKDVDFYTAVALTEKKFMKRFIDPYKNSAPELADAYAAACAGQVPPVIQP